MCTHCSTNSYATNIKSAIRSNPTFRAICDFNVEHFPADGYCKYYRSLENGKTILQTPEQLNTYIASYGDMHRIKLMEAFKELFFKESFTPQGTDVIDWGCGQAFASCVLIDFIKEAGIRLNIKSFTLIEPSSLALQRGVDHINAIFQQVPPPSIRRINEKADSLPVRSLVLTANVKLHLFSNLLDIETLDLNRIASVIKDSQPEWNYFVCISPIGGGRIESFFKMFPSADLISRKISSLPGTVFRPSAMKKVQHSISRIEYIFKVKL